MRTIPGIFGRPSWQPFAFFDPDSWSVRTSQATLLSDSTGCSVTLPKWGTACGGALYELPTPGLLTSGHGSSGLLGTPSAADAMGGHLSRGGARSHELLLKGQVKALLPTPAAQEPGGTAQAHLDRKNRLDGAKRVTPTHLSLVMQLLPTPAVNDMGAGKTPEQWDEWTDRMREAHGNGNGHGRSLSIEAARLLPTPVSTDAGGARNSTANRRPDSTGNPGDTLTDAMWKTHRPDLVEAARLLPTPRTSDANGTGHHGTGGQDLRTSLGDLMSPLFDGGSTSPEPSLLDQPTIEDA